ncbi:MAG: hypothetical protein EAZ80_13385 [Runella slithyformis]|nr:MAG: hypothetical protein EAZ80_13385 [Runella slithyformis]
MALWQRTRVAKQRSRSILNALIFNKLPKKVLNHHAGIHSTAANVSAKKVGGSQLATGIFVRPASY